MQSTDDPQFSIVREYQVWGVQNGEERYCTFDTFEEAEEVRRNGHPLAPHWKPNRRKRVKFGVALYRTVAFPGSQEVQHYPVAKVGNVAHCDVIHATDADLRRLSAPPPKVKTLHSDQHGVFLWPPTTLMAGT